MPDDLVDKLLAQTGRYVGPQRDPSSTAAGPLSVARIEVIALPGDTGVAFDYEVLSAERGQGHAEHTMLARTTDGLTLVVAHSHGPVMSILQESEPGYFVLADGASPFPMAIRIEVPEPGRIVYSWSYGAPGEDLQVRDVGDVRLLA